MCSVGLHDSPSFCLRGLMVWVTAKVGVSRSSSQRIAAVSVQLRQREFRQSFRPLAPRSSRWELEHRAITPAGCRRADVQERKGLAVPVGSASTERFGAEAIRHLGIATTEVLKWLESRASAGT